MIDLDKRSHRHYSNTFYSRITRPELTSNRRDLYLDMANDAELHGQYDNSLELRKLALGDGIG